MRTYVPSKPNPLVLKNFILASSDGLVLDFAIYTGKGTIPDSDQKEHGLGAGILKLLARTISNDYNHVIYSDRFFTSTKSVQLLLDRNIFQTGTVMANRIKEVASKFKRDQELQRGQWDEYVRKDQEICALKWKDNKSITFLSSCIGIEPEGTCKRWCNTEKAKVLSKRWDTKTKVDVSHKLQNSLVPRLGKVLKIVDSLEQSKEIFPSVTQEYVNSSDEDEQHQPTKRRRIVPKPTRESKCDRVDHLPEYIESSFASRGRLLGCKSRSCIMCKKCKVYLGVLKNNCFAKFNKHEK
ncbi:uncharacterized protein LOC126267851 [Schistocerca gregaria]|uniref:uncharacterized protein LOC126267851 n=1 Tax=Schistocerca gregaria TaxID=7010 RepID=UPI00211E5231|nr:uncharacterized protein LOC126267851 [Schistocerca gregaria]